MMNYKNIFSRRLFFSFLYLAAFCFFVHAEDSDFKLGETLFKENKIVEAIPYLEKSISSGKDLKAYNYLVLCYQSQGLLKEGLALCSEAMKISGTDKKILALNAGNICYSMGDFHSAEKWYSLSIAANRLYAPPVLNRANAELKQEKFLASLEDYKLYLDLSPNDRQKVEIEQIIAMLEEIKKREEERLAEEKRIREEEERVAREMEIQNAIRNGGFGGGAGGNYQGTGYGGGAGGNYQGAGFADGAGGNYQGMSQNEFMEALKAEKAKKEMEDAERRRKLLEEIESSLENSDMSNFDVGAEGTVDYGYETELE